jgi:hypothetical protein
MARILSTDPSTSALVSGVRFERTDAGMLSEEVADAVAEHFCRVPGYALAPEAPAARDKTEDAPATPAAAPQPSEKRQRGARAQKPESDTQA